MNDMFLDNEYFNQDLSNWNVFKVEYHSSFDENATAWVLPKPNFRH